MENNPVTQCPVCQRLEAERDEAERTYAMALKSLEERIETPSRAEFTKLRIAESEARLDLEILRIQLEKHRLQHKEGLAELP